MNSAAKSFDVFFSNLNEEKYALSRDIYNFFVNEDLKILLNSVPKHFLNFSIKGRLIIEGKYYTLRFKDDVIIPETYNSFTYKFHHDTPETNKIVKEFQVQLEKLDIKEAALNSKKSAFKKELNLKLKNISTLKRLCEVWPEGREYYKHLEENEPNLPTISFNNINQRLEDIKKEISSWKQNPTQELVSEPRS